MASLKPSLRLFAAPALPRVPPGAIIWIFVGIVAAMLAVTFYGVELLAAGRTFIATEARWAKAERDAAFYLSRYLHSDVPEDYLAYQTAIGVIEGSRAASKRAAEYLSELLAKLGA